MKWNILYVWSFEAWQAVICRQTISIHFTFIPMQASQCSNKFHLFYKVLMICICCVPFDFVSYLEIVATYFTNYYTIPSDVAAVSKKKYYVYILFTQFKRIQSLFIGWTNEISNNTNKYIPNIHKKMQGNKMREQKHTHV